MKIADVKVNNNYLFKDMVVKVVERLRGAKTNQRNMQSGILCTGMVRKPKKFRLNNGEIVKANELTLIKNITN